MIETIDHEILKATVFNLTKYGDNTEKLLASLILELRLLLTRKQEQLDRAHYDIKRLARIKRCHKRHYK